MERRDSNSRCILPHPEIYKQMEYIKTIDIGNKYVYAPDHGVGLVNTSRELEPSAKDIKWNFKSEDQKRLLVNLPFSTKVRPGLTD
jgi:hypothetical protein